jgi:hypothetical protein
MSVTTNALNNSATEFQVDNLNLDGNTISSTNTDGNIALSPDGAGRVVSSAEVEATSALIDPGASGDSYIQFDINNTGEFRIGVDDDAGDTFKISQGSALGTNDTFIMTAAGERTMPLQPAFLARLGAVDSNVTGAGTPYFIGTNVAFTEIFDQGGNFNTNGTFTAPITGRYFFTINVHYSGVTDSGYVNGQVTFVTSNRNYFHVYNPYACRLGDLFSHRYDVTLSSLVDMDAGDTTRFRINVQGGATNGMDLESSAGTDLNNWVSGYLVV